MPDVTRPTPNITPLTLGAWWCMEPSALAGLRVQLASAPSITLEAKKEIEAAAATGIPVKLVESVAVIPVAGPLTKRYSLVSFLFGGSSYLGIKAAIQASLADKRVKFILLLVDSLGGEVGGMGDVGDLIASAKTQKPIVVQIDDMAASAAYYIASQGTEVWAGPRSELGSIGVYAVVYEQAKKEGVRPVMVRSGDLKGIGARGVPITKEQEAEVEARVERLADDFIEAVARGRNMTEDEARELATGALWPAAEAHKKGLIDGIRTLEATIETLVERERAKARGRSRSRIL